MTASAAPSRTRQLRPLIVLAGATGLIGAAALPAIAATVDTLVVTGTQQFNPDCPLIEFTVRATLTGTDDDGGGLDRVVVAAWDDGEIMDSEVLGIPVGVTQDHTTVLSWLGSPVDGAPGVGVIVHETDATEEPGEWLDFVDPVFPEEEVSELCELTVDRIGGANRFETAVRLSQQFASADTVVLATGDDYPDALAAGPLARQEHAPLLLTHPDHLPLVTAAEFGRLLPDRIIVIGGEAAVSEEVVDLVKERVPGAVAVDRIAGRDRYATAAKVAAEIAQDSTAQVFLATGADYPDALVLSALAARESGPLLLAKADRLPAATRQFLKSTTYDTLTAAGGPDVLSHAVVGEAADLGEASITRFHGIDRYATASAVLGQFPADGTALIASGADFPDALTSVPMAAREGAGLALSQSDHVPATVQLEIARIGKGSSFPVVTLIGGATALTPNVVDEVLALFD